ncbi:MAG: HAD-IA family hydrolase [DPANN group archaeon]|nr:HAD-IA family hydrolase [DPANN group archaeon]
MAKKLAICLDLDGTLVSSGLAHIKALQEAFTKNGYPKKSDKEIAAKFGIPTVQVVNDFFPKANPKDVIQIVKDKTHFFITDTYRYSKQIPGVIEALNELKDKFKLAVITNSSMEEAKILLKAAKLPEEFFDDVVTVEQVKNPKPYADEIKKVEKDLNTKVLYVVGDTVFDIMAGEAAGAKTVAVLSGYHSSEQLRGANPTYVIESVAELPDLVFGRI